MVWILVAIVKILIAKHKTTNRSRQRALFLFEKKQARLLLSNFVIGFKKYLLTEKSSSNNLPIHELNLTVWLTQKQMELFC